MKNLFKLRDGCVNKLFYCSLPEDIETKPNKVVIRIVDNDLKYMYDFAHVLSISLLLSERGIAPKILASFQYGTIIEYVQVGINKHSKKNRKHHNFS